MTKIETYGFIEKGVLKITNRKRFDAEIKQVKDCDVQIIVKKRGKRSTQANRYYWGILVESIRLELLNRGSRYSPEDIHEWLKIKFNPVKLFVNESTGEVIEIGGSTTAFNKEEMGSYLDRIIQWCAENLEIVIPLPSQQAAMF